MVDEPVSQDILRKVEGYDTAEMRQHLIQTLIGELVANELESFDFLASHVLCNLY